MWTGSWTHDGLAGALSVEGALLAYTAHHHHLHHHQRYIAGRSPRTQQRRTASSSCGGGAEQAEQVRSRQALWQQSRTGLGGSNSARITTGPMSASPSATPRHRALTNLQQARNSWIQESSPRPLPSPKLRSPRPASRPSPRAEAGHQARPACCSPRAAQGAVPKAASSRPAAAAGATGSPRQAAAARPAQPKLPWTRHSGDAQSAKPATDASPVLPWKRQRSGGGSA